MATNVFSGRQGSLRVGASSSATTRFGAVQNWEVTVSRSEVPVVHTDTNGWQEQLAGIANWSLTCGTVFLSTAATTNEQDTLRGALSSGTRRYFQLYDSTGAGGAVRQGWGFVTGYTWGAASLDAPQLQNFTVAGDGAVTEV